MVVFYVHILKLGFRLDKMKYHVFKNNATQFQTLEIAKRRLVITFYDKNNHKFILHENAVFNRDTMKTSKNHAKLTKQLESVATSKFFIGFINFNKYKPKLNRFISRSMSDKVNQKHNNSKLLEQTIKPNLFKKNAIMFYKMFR